LKNYRFELIESDIVNFVEKDHVIPAYTLTDALHKFVRKHDLEAPAYWDEPSFETHIEITFKSTNGRIKYHISW
jgi:hypothetical protein